MSGKGENFWKEQMKDLKMPSKKFDINKMSDEAQTNFAYSTSTDNMVGGLSDLRTSWPSWWPCCLLENEHFKASFIYKQGLLYSSPSVFLDKAELVSNGNIKMTIFY